MKFSNFDSKDGNNLKNVINSHKNRQNINSTQEQEEENEEQQSSLKDKAAGMGKEAIKEGASEAVHAATGVPKGIVKPVVSAVVDKVGDEAIDEVVNQAKQQVKKSIRKVVLKALSAAAPYLLVIFLIVFVVGIIMTEFYQIVDKVDQALVKASEYEEKFLNWSTGNGWKTEEEQFFQTLNKEYEVSKEFTGGKGFNAPLIAATIHYNYMIELDLYKEDEDLGETKTKHKEDYIGTGDEESLFDDFIRSKDTKNFYLTANDKLGEVGAIYNALNIGQRKLLGHLVMPEFSWDLYTISEAVDKWQKFFNYIGNGTPDIGTLLTSWMVSPKISIVSYLKNLLSTAKAYADQDGSAGWFEYTYQNALYEIEELVDYFESKEDYLQMDHDEAHGISGAIDSFVAEQNQKPGIGDILEFVVKTLKKGAIFPAPSIEYIYTEEVYKDYLRNIYIPLTYGVGEPRSYGSDAAIDYKLDTIVSEIYNQSDTFIYLFQVDTALGEDCHYELVGVEDGEEIDESSLSGTVMINGIPLTNEVIDNLYVRITNGSSKGQTVSMEEYMIGVMSAEINTITNIEARKANMVAQQTYLFKGGCGNGYVALHQEADGNYYVSIDGTSNCQSYSSSQARADEIRELYNEMKYEFLYNEKTGSLYPIQYRTYYKDPKNSETNKDCFPERVGTCMGQKESDVDAANGMSYRDILAKYYMDSGLISYGNGKRYIRKYVCYSKGLVAGSHGGFPVRTSGCPNPQEKINNPFPNGSCVWYAKGRGMEIIETAKGLDESTRRTLKNALNGCWGDGNSICRCLQQQTDASGKALFGYSSSPSDAKPGAIACYDNKVGSKYGHVIVVEDVSGENVTVSQWVTLKGKGPTCMSYTKPLSEMSTDSYTTNGGKFLGYVFLLN